MTVNLENCKLCNGKMGVRYCTLIGPTEKDTFNICWDCKQKVGLDGTGYHPSYHDDGPPGDTYVTLPDEPS